MIVDLFSKRCRMQRGEMPDVYIYDSLPDVLRVQIIYIIDDLINKVLPSRAREPFYEVLSKCLREERGKDQLYNSDDVYKPHPNGWGYGRIFDYEKEIKGYFRQEGNVENALDVIHVAFRTIAFNIKDEKLSPCFIKAIKKLNARFKEHGIGYAFEGNSIIRIDNELIHQEIVKPALQLLHDKEFKNAEDEYLRAHEHYRHGHIAECLADCSKAVETTIKIIGHKRGWNIEHNAVGTALIKHVINNGLIPQYLQEHFSSLKKCLESGVPVVRNKEPGAGHGKGTNSDPIPAYMAEYLLGETAVTIRLLVEAYRQSAS
jgi:hypothetical protein